MLKKLGAHRRQNRLDSALREIGRIERALITFDGLESKPLYQQCQAGLNKGETRPSFAQAVLAPKQGRMRDRTYNSQALKAAGLKLVTAAIVYWNTLYIGQAIDHLRAIGESALDDLLSHVPPLRWRHKSLTSDYLWQEVSTGIGDTGFWELNISEEAKT
jgi:TnpA family transposase